MSKKQSAGRHDFNLFKKDSSPYFYVRLMHGGKRRKFSTGETSVRAAHSKAVVIVADIRSRGFDEAVKIHSRRRDTIPGDPTVGQFVAQARKIFQTGLSDPPSRPTYERYLKDFQRISKSTAMKFLSDLDAARVERFVENYQKSALAKGRDPKRVRSTIHTIIRNGSALFSERMIRAYGKTGITIAANPFHGVELPPVRIVPYSPLPASLLRKICGDAQLLRNGDPEAEPPVKVRNRSLGPDFRTPQVGAYLLFLLELGLGLRRNEADKAQWDWVLPTVDGRHIMEVRETPFFRPKSRQRRVIPVPKQILDELAAFRRDHDPFIVPGNWPKAYAPAEEPLNLPCRCEEHHRALVEWLRNRGVDDDKPCHRLRKEFGSAVATTFGLFAAQKMLGHSSPLVTEACYAGLTELPHLEQAGFYASLSTVPTNPTEIPESG